MSTDNNPLSSLLSGLQLSVDQFLKKVDDEATTASANRDKEADLIAEIVSPSTSTQSVSAPMPEDMFTRVHDRLLARMRAAGRLPLDPLSSPSQSDSITKDSDSSSPTAPKSAELSHQNTVREEITNKPAGAVLGRHVVEEQASPDEIIFRMNILLAQMSGITPTPSISPSWKEMDRISVAIRGAWVSALSQGATPAPSSAGWLDTWSNIISDIQAAAPSWSLPQSSTWTTWAALRQKEAAALRPWLAPASVQQSALSVPSIFENSGVIPSPPPSVPKELVENLQQCADFWEFCQSNNNTLHWKNTPTKQSFSQNQNNLENWEAKTKSERAWKETALDRYTVLEARIILRSSEQKNASRSTAPSRIK